MTRLVLIRHGVTKWNKEKRYCGRKDISLNSKGKLQARLLSNTFDSAGIDKVYCSSQKRAMQTARILFKQARIIPEKGLCEINFGVLEGLKHEEIMEKYADIYTEWIKNSFENSIPKAEPMVVFKNRVENALRNIVQSNRGKTIAVVCHGGVIGIFVNSILKNRNFWQCVPSPASVTVVEHDKGKSRIKILNDTKHLKVRNE